MPSRIWAAARANTLALPHPARGRRALVEIIFIEIRRALLVGADEQPAHHRNDSRHRARDRHRVLGLLVRLDPP